MTILVTGASRGIGAAVVDAALLAGESVIGVSRSLSPAQRESGEPLRWVEADLASDEGMARVVGACSRRPEPRLRGVVLSAGIVVRSPFIAARVGDVDPLRAQLCTNLEYPLLLLRALLSAELVEEGASIVFVSSNLARHSEDANVAYAASKGGIESAVRSLARQLGPSATRVNAVAPGLVHTDMSRDLDDRVFADYAARVPLRRVGLPSDIAPVVLFLLGEGSRYMTGQVLDVDGGWGA